MIDFQNFIEIKEPDEKEKRAMCPKIVLSGWWWKKFFKKYRDLSRAMNDIKMHHWLNGGYEEYQQAIMDVLALECEHTQDRDALLVYQALVNGENKVISQWIPRKHK